MDPSLRRSEGERVTPCGDEKLRRAQTRDARASARSRRAPLEAGRPGRRRIAAHALRSQPPALRPAQPPEAWSFTSKGHRRVTRHLAPSLCLRAEAAHRYQQMPRIFNGCFPRRREAFGGVHASEVSILLRTASGRFVAMLHVQVSRSDYLDADGLKANPAAKASNTSEHDLQDSTKSCIPCGA